jgi:tetratricopeptide (TPR) repeat protein
MQMRANLARTEGAYVVAERLYCGAADRGYQVPETQRRCATSRVRNHDALGAEATWARLPPDARPPVEAIVLTALAAEVRGDAAGAVAAYERWDLATRIEDREERRPTAVWPGMAVALARAGRQAEAEALAARLPDCYQCLRAKGRVAALGGERPEAERWLTAAIRRAPEVPFAHYDLAEARFAAGDLTGAARALEQAKEHGPRWADPYKLEGDLLARRGDHGGALRRYSKAAERAPRWGALHLAWGRSLEASGRRDEARAKYAQAARLDLSPADREAVQRLLARQAA